MCTDPLNKANPRDKRSAGFTLIEILVALIIFSVMSGLGYRALASVLDSRAAVVTHNKKWRGIELFFARLEQDLGSITRRSIHNQGNLVEPPLMASAEALGPNGAQLTFTRSGWGGATGAAADEQRVAYRLRDKRVELLIWPVLDQAPYSQAGTYSILEAVESMQLRYLDATGGWRAAWGSPTDSALPKAVELTLTLASGERLIRLLALP